MRRLGILSITQRINYANQYSVRDGTINKSQQNTNHGGTKDGRSISQKGKEKVDVSH